MFSVPTTVAGCSVKRLIRPTVLCSHQAKNGNEHNKHSLTWHQIYEEK
ncbi:hypothetical protein ECDEC9A_2648 [Escherichia coli DEC9A]|nr:hypothetical protein ECDEC9A_2648 [Escherichia coli DEC9A]EHW73067.1 hypothetical protein ECDEC10C_3258 [Escherichia coli DEC10C]